jgi:anti-sigma B factor antagonist
MTTDQLIKSEQDGDVTVISFLQGAETINSTIVDQIANRLTAMARNASDQVLIDFQRVEFFNSMFIELLVRCWKVIREKPKGQLALCQLRPYCREILEVTNLDNIWPIYPNREVALEQMQHPVS